MADYIQQPGSSGTFSNVSIRAAAGLHDYRHCQLNFRKARTLISRRPGFLQIGQTKIYGGVNRREMGTVCESANRTDTYFPHISRYIYVGVLIKTHPLINV